MNKWVKNVVIALVATFLLFYLVTNPTGAADAVKTVLGWFASIPVFFSQLAS